MVLSLTLSAASSARARKIKLILPIAAALEAANVQDRPSGSVKFFLRQSDNTEDRGEARQLCRNAKDRIVSVMLKGELVKIADE